MAPGSSFRGPPNVLEHLKLILGHIFMLLNPEALSEPGLA